MKEKIKNFILGMMVDDAGFADLKDYNSPRSPKIESIFPGAQSIIVLAYKEAPSCESPNMQIAMSGRMDIMEFARSCNYKLVRFLEKEFGAKAMAIPMSYPLEMSLETMGCIGDVSLRHAAVAAGLGVFGRHNIVIHPRFGTRVVFSAVLSDIKLASDAPVKKRLCTDCGLCVSECPAGALNDEGRTDVMSCLKISQPYGIAGSIKFWSNFAGSSLQDQKKMLKDPEFWRLYQAGLIGFQYFCFNCLKVCPVGQK